MAGPITQRTVASGTGSGRFNDLFPGSAMQAVPGEWSHARLFRVTHLFHFAGLGANHYGSGRRTAGCALWSAYKFSAFATDLYTSAGLLLRRCHKARQMGPAFEYSNGDADDPAIQITAE